MRAAATTGALSALVRPRGATPHPRSGAEARRTPCPKGGSQEELPHVRGQGQKLGGLHALRAATKRSYPTSEVRGNSREYQAVTAQERPRRATQVRGQGQWPGGSTPRLRSGAAPEKSYPTSKSGVAAERSYPTSEVSGGRPRGVTPCPRSGATAGGATPRS